MTAISGTRDIKTLARYIQKHGERKYTEALREAEIISRASQEGSFDMEWKIQGSDILIRNGSMRPEHSAGYARLALMLNEQSEHADAGIWKVLNVGPTVNVMLFEPFSEESEVGETPLLTAFAFGESHWKSALKTLGRDEEISQDSQNELLSLKQMFLPDEDWGIPYNTECIASNEKSIALFGTIQSGLGLVRRSDGGIDSGIKTTHLTTCSIADAVADLNKAAAQFLIAVERKKTR